MPCHILGDIRLDPILVLGGPVEEMRGIGAAHHVDRVNTARLLLVDALIDTLGAGAFDPDGNAGIFRLEGAGQPFRSVELQRGIEAGVAFLFCGLDQRWRHGTRRRRRGFKRLRKNGSRAKSNTGLEHGAARYMLVVHAVPPGCCLPLMGKSDGKSDGKSISSLVFYQSDDGSGFCSRIRRYVPTRAYQECLAKDSRYHSA